MMFFRKQDGLVCARMPAIICPLSASCGEGVFGTKKEPAYVLVGLVEIPDEYAETERKRSGSSIVRLGSD